MISAISPEQRLKLVNHCQQWQQLMLKTGALDLNSVEVIIQAAYLEAGFAEPEIWHYSNPWAAVKSLALKADPRCTRRKAIWGKFNRRIFGHLRNLIERQLTANLKDDLWEIIRASQPSLLSGGALGQLCITDELNLQLEIIEQQLALEPLCIDLCMNLHWANYSTSFHCFWDFCISELKVEHDLSKWNVLQSFVKDCGFLIMFEEVCVSIERPCRLQFDAEGQFHSVVEPAIVFADGYGVSAHHGLHPSRLEE